MISLFGNGIAVNFEGKITRVPTHLGYTNIDTINYRRKSEKVRSVVDLNLTISNMSQEDYLNLETMFLTSVKSINITNTSTGESYKGYFLDGETLNLEPKEDFQNNVYIYTGNITLKRR